MICPNCGTDNRPGARFCAKCGASLISETVAWSPPTPAPDFSAAPSAPPPGGAATYGPLYEPPAAPKTSGLAIASLILGIVGLLGLACYGVGIIPSAAALITGLIARRRIRENPTAYQGAGLALAGTILGGIPVALFALACVIIFMLTLLGSQVSQVFSQISSGLSSP